MDGGHVYVYFLGVRAKCTASISHPVSHVFCEVGMKQGVPLLWCSRVPSANGALLSVPRSARLRCIFARDKTQPPTWWTYVSPFHFIWREGGREGAANLQVRICLVQKAFSYFQVFI